MNLLIIGGTVFLGPALIAAALERGHNITMFNRGKSNPAAFPDIETIIGDRETDLARLKGRRWDAVIDTCGYLPRLVRLSAQALRDNIDHYTLISTLSVYPLEGAASRDEQAALMTIDDDSVEEISDSTYGPLKVGCENALLQAFADRALIIRAGLLVGPGDPTNRFTYWVTRTAKGDNAIAPPAAQPLQFVDVRDIAEFTLRRTEARASEIYNVTGPAHRMTFGDLLPIAKHALNSDVVFHHVSDEFLRQQEIGEFMELPLWLNRELAESFMTFNFDKALRDGLQFRSPAITIRDTCEWAKTLPDSIDKPADLSPEKEQELLAALRA